MAASATIAVGGDPTARHPPFSKWFHPGFIGHANLRSRSPSFNSRNKTMTLSAAEKMTAETSGPKIRRKVPFLFAQESKKFSEELLRTLRYHMDRRVTQVIPPENISRYGHGRQWAIRSSDRPNDIGTVEEHSAAFQVSGKDIVDGKLEVLTTYIDEATARIFQAVMQSLYATIHQATDRTGNVVDAQKAGSLAQAFKEGLEKVAFGVDAEGNVSMPEFHLHPDLAEHLHRELEGPEFARQIEEIKARKSREALEEEAIRRRRFKGLRGPDVSRALLAVGCDSYDHIGGLSGAERDARQIYELLCGPAFGDYEPNLSSLLSSPRLTDFRPHSKRYFSRVARLTCSPFTLRDTVPSRVERSIFASVIRNWDASLRQAFASSRCSA